MLLESIEEAVVCLAENVHFFWKALDHHRKNSPSYKGSQQYHSIRLLALCSIQFQATLMVIKCVSYQKGLPRYWKNLFDCELELEILGMFFFDAESVHV